MKGLSPSVHWSQKVRKLGREAENCTTTRRCRQPSATEQAGGQTGLKMGLGKGGASGQTEPLPSWAEVAGTSHRLLSSHTASSTLASLSSRSRAHASWQRRGPNVPSFWRIGMALSQDEAWGGWSPGTTSPSMHGEDGGSQSMGGVPLSKSQMLEPWGSGEWKSEEAWRVSIEVQGSLG